MSLARRAARAGPAALAAPAGGLPEIARRSRHRRRRGAARTREGRPARAMARTARGEGLVSDLSLVSLIHRSAAALERADFAYAIIGAFARNAWARPRATTDADLAIAVSPEQ